MTNQTPESVIAEVIEYHADTIGSHYDGCYKHHAPCLAVKLRDMLREPGVPDAATEQAKQELAACLDLRAYWRGQSVKARSERDAATAAVDAIRTLHERGTVQIIAFDHSRTPRETCLHCSQVQEGEQVSPGDAYIWPCPTVAALDGAPEPEWEYGFELIEPDDRNVFEREGDFISAAFAYRAAKKRIDEEHQADLQRLQYLIVRRRKAGPWLPVEGESDD